MSHKTNWLLQAHLQDKIWKCLLHKFAKEMNTKERLQLCEHLSCIVLKLDCQRLYYSTYFTSNTQLYILLLLIINNVIWKKYYPPAWLDVQVGIFSHMHLDRQRAGEQGLAWPRKSELVRGIWIYCYIVDYSHYASGQTRATWLCQRSSFCSSYWSSRATSGLDWC